MGCAVAFVGVDMAGKLTDGTDFQLKLKQVKAYAEGVEARMASATPGDSPHVADTEDDAAWDRGVADAAAGTVDKCVAGWDRTAAT